MPGEEDELQDTACGGQQPGPSSDLGWNANPAQQPQEPNQPPQAPYQPPQAPYQPPDLSYFQPPAPESDAPNLGSNTSLPFHLPDPPKDPEPKNPGGFVPFNPSTSNMPMFQSTQPATSFSPEQIAKAQKYCKYVASALTYDDVPTAIDNLQKCLRLLQTGQDS